MISNEFFFPSFLLFWQLFLWDSEISLLVRAIICWEQQQQQQQRQHGRMTFFGVRKRKRDLMT